MPGKNGVLSRELEARGVSRRDFIKYCGTIAAMLGLDLSAAPQIAEALDNASALKPVIWLEAGLSVEGLEEIQSQAEEELTGLAQGLFPEMSMAHVPARLRRSATN